MGIGGAITASTAIVATIGNYRKFFSYSKFFDVVSISL